MRLARGKIVHSHGRKLTSWRETVEIALVSDYRTRHGAGVRAIDAPVAVSIRCVFERPKSVARSVHWKTSAPDADKLERAVLDALTRVVISDDSRVVKLYVEKVYAKEGEHPGAQVVVTRLEQPE